MDPWFDAQTAGIAGGIAGTLVGVVYGGIVGGVGGVLASMGKGRSFVLWMYRSGIGFGAASLLVGLFALVRGQPYHVWYGFVLIGAVLCAVLGFLLPVIKQQYRMHEQRKLDADAIREG